MRVHLDPHTGQTVLPEAVPAYLAHPSNAGRVVELVPMLTFTAPAEGISPAPGRAAIEPPQIDTSAIAGPTPGDGSSPTVSGATSHNHTHNSTHNPN